MNVKEFMEKLKDEGFNMDGLEIENKYSKIKNDEIKIGLYARISKKDKNNTAIESQFKALKLFTESIDKSIRINCYSDYGISGTTVLREGYNALITDIKKGDINLIFTTNVDRFGRRVDNILSVLYPQDGDGFIYVSYDDMLVNTFPNRDKITKCAADAENYATVYSKKTRRGINTKMRTGSYIGSKAPFGLIKKKLGDKIILEPADDITALVVKEIFNSYLIGKSLGCISNELTKKGYKTPTGNEKWEKGTIESILKNIKYAGIMAQGLYKKKGPFADGESSNIVKIEKDKWIYGDDFNGIVSIEDFNKVQNMLKENKSLRDNKDRHLFTSIIKCGDCGRALIYKGKSSGYKCAGSQDGSGCTSHLVKEEELFRLIKSKIVKYIEENIESIKPNFKNIAQKDNKVSFYEIQVKEIELQIEELEKLSYEAYTEFKREYIRETMYKTIIKENEKKLDSLMEYKNSLIEKINKLNIIAIKSESKLDNIEELIIKDNRILKILIKSIKVYEENKIEIVWKY